MPDEYQPIFNKWDFHIDRKELAKWCRLVRSYSHPDDLEGLFNAYKLWAHNCDYLIGRRGNIKDIDHYYGRMTVLQRQMDKIKRKSI